MKLQSFFDLEKLLPESDRKKNQTAIHSEKQRHDGKGMRVHVSLDTKGRKGKTVTLITGLRHNPTTIEEIARQLKQHCGAGGTVKEGAIEIQGDHHERIKQKLREMNYDAV